jgi:hypothetical protein
MSVLGPRAQSRSATLLVAVAVHGLILWAIWRVRVPVAKEVESFASVMFFLPQAVVPRTPVPAAPIASDARQASPAAEQLQPARSTTAITLPAAPSPPIDWSAQLALGARAELDLEEQARKQLRAVTRRFELDPDPRNPGRAPASSFRWYEAGIHHIDTRGSLPVLVLNDRCAMLMFIVPFCRIGHIEIHGDLFDGAATAHGDRLATPGPNEVP